MRSFKKCWSRHITTINSPMDSWHWNKVMPTHVLQCVICPPAKYPAPCLSSLPCPFYIVTGFLAVSSNVKYISYLAIFPPEMPCFRWWHVSMPWLDIIFSNNTTSSTSLASQQMSLYSLCTSLFFFIFLPLDGIGYVDDLFINLFVRQNPHKQWLSLLFSLHYHQGLIGSPCTLCLINIYWRANGDMHEGKGHVISFFTWLKGYLFTHLVVLKTSGSISSHLYLIHCHQNCPHLSKRVHLPKCQTDSMPCDSARRIQSPDSIAELEWG